MTRLAVPQRPHSPLDQAREALDRIEARLGTLRGAGPSAVELLTLLDRVAEKLEELEAAGADVRAERSRLDSAWSNLQRKATLFLREVGPALAEARRQRGDAATSHPWWSLDRTVAQTRRRALGKAALACLAVALALGAAWLAYDRFLAPPPHVRQALAHITRGEERIAEGDLTGALEEFEAAAALQPEDVETLLWIGILRQATGDEEGAREAYRAAQDLGLEEREFLFRRGSLLFQIGDLDGALADAEAVVELDPHWGYGYYLKASVQATKGEVQDAIEGYRHAADLAHEAGDAELEAMARVQMGLLLQYQR